MWGQSAPTRCEAALASIRDKAGMGYHDIDCTGNVPAQLQNRINAAAPFVASARQRMRAIKHVVEPFLEGLADESISRTLREQRYQEVKAAIREFDYGSEDEKGGDPDDEYDAHRDDEARDLYEEEMRDLYNQEMRDFVNPDYFGP